MNLPSKRPTISLAIIAKNEERNLPRLLDSVEGCFDEIVVVDTGSTDKTVQIATDRGCKISHFEWVNDFSKARNFAFSQCTSDYILWLDCDDVLWNRDAFIQWRDHGMEHCDMAFNAYHYAVEIDHTKDWKTQELKPLVSFVRERVFKRSLNPTWQYALHEGIIPNNFPRKTYITTWSVKHLRSQEDMQADRSRNITIIEDIVSKNQGDARMQFYYGKELHEIGRHEEAIRAMDKAITMNLESHDRILAYQYGAYAAIAMFERTKDEFKEEKERYFKKVMDFSFEGLKHDPHRAEFYISIAEMYLRVNQIDKSVPFFSAAKNCLKNFDSPYAGAIYSFKNLYGEAPTLQLSKVYAHLGLLDKAKKEAEECIELYKNKEAEHVLKEVEKVSCLVKLDNNQVQTEDIVFTCPPQTAYPFDEELYKTQPLGGSETALVQMARLLREKTGRPVKVFNMREKPLTATSGVEYLPAGQLNEYMSKNRPHTHIAWRHNIRVTRAQTYLWGHDLTTAGVETSRNFDKMLCLSQFHKDYTMAMCGVPEDQIIVTRNGIDPKKFEFIRKPKNQNKFVWMSSPDRGLERCILILDEARKEFPNIELHVYYGFENLYKFGLGALADKVKSMMSVRPWIKYHGFTEQNKMYREVSDAVVWNHNNDFIETFCITALETLANGIFPIARRLGALNNTLHDAETKGQAILLDYDYDDTEKCIKLHVDAIRDVLTNKRWENVSLDMNKYSWDSVADEWIDFMNLTQAQAKEEAS